MSRSGSVARQSDLRWIVDAYERAQEIRLEMGERLRAFLQNGRNGGSGPPGSPSDVRPARTLEEVRSGETDGPYPLLGRTYRRHWTEESELRRAMERLVHDHPAWPWLERVRGVGTTLAGRLLGRLDVRKADTPSGFWAYCGLATVPGAEYRCSTCGLRRSLPAGWDLRSGHDRFRGDGACPGRLERHRGPEDGVRVAQPAPGRGRKRSYDPTAKKVCYLIGTSFLKNGGAYEELYREERRKLERTRSGWRDGRKHLTALRKVEKAFLVNLWCVWREAEGLELTEPYPTGVQGQPRHHDPWKMVESASG